MCMLLPGVYYCYVYVTVGCIVDASVNCVKLMLLSGVYYYIVHVTVKCTLLSCVCYW